MDLSIHILPSHTLILRYGREEWEISLKATTLGASTPPNELIAAAHEILNSQLPAHPPILSPPITAVSFANLPAPNAPPPSTSISTQLGVTTPSALQPPEGLLTDNMTESEMWEFLCMSPPPRLVPQTTIQPLRFVPVSPAPVRPKLQTAQNPKRSRPSPALCGNNTVLSKEEIELIISHRQNKPT